MGEGGGDFSAFCGASSRWMRRREKLCVHCKAFYYGIALYFRK